MVDNFVLVKVDADYCNYLRKFDERVSYNNGQKELRPFIGILFKINEYEYFAPLTSPKIKHKRMRNTVDFVRLDNGELGAINFNNMIPVFKSNYTLLDLDTTPEDIKDKKYHQLLIDQLAWLNSNRNSISKKAHNLYRLYVQNKLFDNIKSRCCNYPLLEEKCDLYQKETVKV